MKKRISKLSQISVFIILGIVLVAALSLSYGFKIIPSNRDSEFFSHADIKPAVENIEANIILCLHKSGREGLRTIGLQGGYYDKPEKRVDLSKGFIPYYYYEGNYLMPGNERISEELGKFVQNKVNSCLDGLKFEGFQLTHTQPRGDVFINKSSVLMIIDSSVVVHKDGRRIVFNTRNYPVSQNSALKDILDVAQYITESHRLDSKNYCISCVDRLAEEKNVYVSNIPLKNDSVLIIIGENRTSDEPYLFSFLNKYNNEVSDDFKLTGEFAEGIPGTGGVGV